jgi:hypothetical protein
VTQRQNSRHPENGLDSLPSSSILFSSREDKAIFIAEMDGEEPAHEAHLLYYPSHREPAPAVEDTSLVSLRESGQAPSIFSRLREGMCFESNKQINKSRMELNRTCADSDQHVHGSTGVHTLQTRTLRFEYRHWQS